MGFFSSIVSGVTSFLGSDTGASVVNAAASLGAAYLSSQANEAAAETAAAATDRATASVIAGNQQAQQRYEQQAELTQPAVTQLRRISASDPSQLTPSQTQGLEDLQRNFGASSAAYGLRGAGRAGLAATREAEATYHNQAYDVNQRRIDQATQALADQNFSTTAPLAGLDTRTGDAAGAGELDRAAPGINADLANTSLAGESIGVLSAVINDEQKRRGRPSRERLDQERT